MLDKNIQSVLDKYPAFQLRDVFLITRQLISWSEEKTEKGDFLFTVPMENFANIGIRPEQVHPAIEIFRQIHQKKYGKAKNGGLLSQPPPGPELRTVDGEVIIRNLIWIPLRELDAALSKREGVAPVNLISFHYNLKDGIYLEDSSERPCPLTRQQYNCIQFIHTKGRATLKDLSILLKATDSNISRCIKDINKAFTSHYKTKDDFILHNVAPGFYLNQAKFSISGS